VAAAAMVQALEVGKEAMAEPAALPEAYRVLQAKTDKTVFCSTAAPVVVVAAAAAIARAACPVTAAAAATAAMVTSPSTGLSALPAPQAPPVSKVPREGRRDPLGR